MTFEDSDIRSIVAYLNSLAKQVEYKCYKHTMMEDGYRKALVDVGTYINAIIEGKKDEPDKVS